MFKNLMLVAVAAMAFTACSEDNNEVNKAEKKVVYEFVASFEDDTRSGFTGSEVAEDGTTIYHSAWTGGETVLLVSNTGEQKTATVDANGHFTAEFTGVVSQVNMYSPASAWAVDGTYAVSTIPAVQTSGVQSVDPAAHIVSGYTMIDTEGTQLITLTLGHAHAYGKMTVNTPEGFEIDYVELDLKGDFYNNARENSYKLYASEETPNLFWFTTEYMTVNEFTLTAYDAEGNALSKTVNMADKEKPLAFSYGKVSTFSVSGLEEPVVPMFTRAEYNGNKSDKVIKLYSDTLGELWMNFYGSNSLITSDNWINPGTYGKGNGMYFGNNYGQYKPVGHPYFATSQPNAFTLDVSIVNGMYKFVINADYTNTSAGVILENATFIGTIPGLDIPDTRTPLATPNVTYSVDGNTVTLSWEPVEGAVGYRVRDYYYDIDTTTTDTTITAELTEYKWYYIYVSALAAEGDANYKNSDEAEISFEHKDPREILPSPSNVKAEVDGEYVTISWDPVNGADSYMLSYYLDGNNEVSVDGTEHTLYIGYSVSNLYVYVSAIANDDNPDYRSSDAYGAYVIVSTGRDPNVLADYMWDETFVWDASGYFLVTDSTYGSSSYWRIYLNAADRPGNNSIKEGTYYGEYNTSNPSVGHFCTRVGADYTAAPFWSFYQTNVQSSWTLEVKVVDGMYQIVMDAVGYGTFGYKGLPDGFVLPSEGDSGDEGDDNTGEGGDDNTGDGGDDNTDVVPDGFTKVDFVSATQGSFGGRQYNWMGDFKFSYMGEEVSFSMCDYNGMQIQNKSIAPGTYVNNGGGANMDTKELYNISVAGMSGMSGSQVEVSKDGNVYTFLMTLVTNYNTVKLYYKGEI